MNIFFSPPWRESLSSFNSRDVATDGCGPSMKVFNLRVFEQLFDDFFNWTLAYQLSVYHHAVRLIASECNRLASSQLDRKRIIVGVWLALSLVNIDRSYLVVRMIVCVWRIREEKASFAGHKDSKTTPTRPSIVLGGN